MKPYAVVFAGVPGTSKTPIAHYLSINFNLPIISTDQIRFEVREDMRLDTIVDNDDALEEFTKRLGERTKKLLASGSSFIFDGSMDRHWQERKQQLAQAGYIWFMIDLELSRPFLLELYRSTGRKDFAKNHLDTYLKQHEEFMKHHSADIHVRVTDNTFNDRLQVSANALQEFIKSL